MNIGLFFPLLFGGLMIAPLAPVLDTGSLDIDASAFFGYAWLAVASGALAYALWFRGARLLPATSTSLIGLLSPLTAALLGWAMLNESMASISAWLPMRP